MSTDTAPPSSAADASSTLATRRHQLFPRLPQEAIERALPCAARRPLADGETLFAEGTRDGTLHVVLSGAIAITRQGQSETVTITTHGPGEFTGEVSALAGQAATATARAVGPTEVASFSLTALRDVLLADPEIGETIMRALILRRVALIESGEGPLLVGAATSPDTLRLRQFLERNGVAHGELDLATDEDAHRVLRDLGRGPERVPLILMPNGDVLERPSNRRLAERLGLTAELPDDKLWDVAIVGAGPGGLAAAVYAASEGLSTVMIEQLAPGGQAGTSSRIENYLGFPTGISGQALAGRAFIQAEKFGAVLALARSAAGLDCGTRPYRVALDSGGFVRARTVVIASGASYRRPPIPELARFEGAGIYYGATAVEAKLCRGEEVIVVGGGNSAGQAATYLARQARCVRVIVRGPGLAETMSDYLVRRIASSDAIRLQPRTEIVALEGDGSLERVRLRCADGSEETLDCRHVFLMIGADPHTGWLDGCLALDGKGFVLTGPDLPPGGWSERRPPHHLETSKPGVFAVGDVRAGSVKRVASSVGEGAACVSLIHQVLADEGH